MTAETQHIVDNQGCYIYIWQMAKNKHEHDLTKIMAKHEQQSWLA